LLVLDAASTRVHTGLLRSSTAAIWRTREEEAGTGAFAGLESIFTESGTTLDDVDAFVFCEGPGSMLGIRTVAMSLRTWQVLRPRPAYAYQSLAIAARFTWSQSPRNLSVIADARRDSWHVQTIGVDGALAALQRVTAAELPKGELLTPENFRSWATPPRPTSMCRYDPGIIFGAISEFDCFRAVDRPDAFQHEAPEYKKWSAQVHSAASAAPK
jgi:tRNA threonylcarbamoyladenosine biosynthesis protein TsaB